MFCDCLRDPFVLRWNDLKGETVDNVYIVFCIHLLLMLWNMYHNVQYIGNPVERLKMNVYCTYILYAYSFLLHNVIMI